jgi:hypothetical protein
VDKQKLTETFNKFVGKPYWTSLYQLDAIASENGLKMRVIHAGGMPDNSIMANRVTVVIDDTKKPSITSIGLY